MAKLVFSGNARQDELLEFADHDGSDLFGNADIGTAVQFGGTIIGVEVGNAETPYWEQ